MKSLALTLVLLVGSLSPMLAQSKLDFTLKNDTGVVIANIYVGPNHSDDWGDDIMG